MAENGGSGLEPKTLETLEAMGVDAGSLDVRTVGQLARMEPAIAGIAEAHRAAKAEMRRHMITKENVSKASGVSRPTINGKPVLERYIEFRRAEEGVLYENEVIASLKRRLKEAEEKVGKLALRDGELVAALAEVERLKDRNKRLEEYIGDIPPYMKEELEAAGRVIPLSGSTSRQGRRR